MGIEWVIADTEKKIYYDLGKGSWYLLTDMEAFQDLEYLINELNEEVYEFHNNYYWDDPDEKQKIQKYVSEKVAPDLYEIFNTSNPKKLIIFSDCHGDDMIVMKAKGYICIGSRYTTPNLSYEELNLHLTTKKSLYSLTESEIKAYDPDNKF